MLKKAIIPMLAGLASLSVYAADSGLDFTYADGELFAYGKNKAETIDIAMKIDNPSMAGMKITGFRAYINNAQNISNTSLWMSKELTLENKVNVPDINSFDVTPEEAPVDGFLLKMLSIVLPEPYTITQEPVYLGYSLTVDKLDNDTDKFPLVLSNNINPNGLFAHMTTNVRQWMDYSSNAGGVAYIVATIESDVPDYDLSIKDYSPIYAEAGKDFVSDFTVLNSGANPITSISYSYAFENGEEKNVKLELPVAIEPSLSTSQLVTLSFTAPETVGLNKMNVTITEVNGNLNKSDNASIECAVNVIPFTPVNRPLVEEYTGLWCQWCPKGYLAMEKLNEDYGDDQVSICYHVDDVMAVTTKFPLEFSGLPAADINRTGQIDPYSGSYDEVDFGMLQNFDEARVELAIAGIDVSATLEGNIIDVNSEVTFIQDIENANYEVGYVLVCNGLFNPDIYYQYNGFANSSGYEGTPLEVLTTWPRYINTLVFNDVAVDVDAMLGVEGSLPSKINTGETYSQEYQFDIAGNELINSTDNLVVTAFVIDKTNGKIVNANKCALKSGAVKSLGNDGEVVSKTYYDLSGREIRNPSLGIYILKEKMNNGTIKTSKLILR